MLCQGVQGVHDQLVTVLTAVMAPGQPGWQLQHDLIPDQDAAAAISFNHSALDATGGRGTLEAAKPFSMVRHKGGLKEKACVEAHLNTLVAAAERQVRWREFTRNSNPRPKLDTAE